MTSNKHSNSFLLRHLLTELTEHCDKDVCLKMHICMSIDVTFTCIAISFHIYCSQFSFKHVMFNFPEGMNQVFELN